MTNRDAIRRQLAIIDDALGSLEFYCETEIVGDDTRHLLTDITPGPMPTRSRSPGM